MLKHIQLKQGNDILLITVICQCICIFSCWHISQFLTCLLFLARFWDATILQSIVLTHPPCVTCRWLPRRRDAKSKGGPNFWIVAFSWGANSIHLCGSPLGYFEGTWFFLHSFFNKSNTNNLISTMCSKTECLGDGANWELTRLLSNTQRSWRINVSITHRTHYSDDHVVLWLKPHQDRFAYCFLKGTLVMRRNLQCIFSCFVGPDKDTKRQEKAPRLELQRAKVILCGTSFN